MPLNPLVIETDYFESIQNRKGLMKAGDFDFQFNNITNYINSSIIPLLNQLIANTTPGTQDPNKVNTYLKNVGDGTTDWSNITFNEIPDLSLSFAKLVQTNPCSILATGVDQIFRAVTPLEDRQSLISQNNSNPVWRKITAANIGDRQITDKKIALSSLVQANFKEGLIAIKLTDNAVTTSKIADNTIPTEKVVNGAVNSDVLGNLIANQFAGRNASKAILWGNTLRDGIIANPWFLSKNNTIFQDYNIKTYPINYTKLTPDFKIPPTLYNRTWAWRVYNSDYDPAKYPNNLAPNCIAGWQIKDNSIDGARLFYQKGTGYPVFRASQRPLGQMIAHGAIGIENLSPSYKAKLGL